MEPLKGLPPLPPADFSRENDPRWRCGDCRDRGYVAGDNVQRFDRAYPTVKPCSSCALGRGISSKRKLDDADRELRRQGKLPSGRRTGRSERMRSLRDAPEEERPTNRRRPTWYEEPEEPDEDPEIPF